MSVLRRHNVTVQGVPDGQPMLFAHGFGCDQNMWRHVWPAFADAYRIVLFDHVGMGQSDVSAYDRPRHATLRGYAADVLDIVHELALSNIVYVGHSVSAVIGLLAAIEEPAPFAHMILVAPSPRYIDDEGYVGGFGRADIEELLESMDANYLGWSANIAPVIMGNPERPELAGELTNSFCQADPDIAREFARVTFLSDNREDLARVRTPSLIMQCERDVIAPQSVGQYMHARLRDSAFVLLDTTGHCPNLSAPDAVISAMREYLS